MLDATAALCGEADLLIAAAAVADFRPQAKAAGKIRREGPITLTLEPTPDIVATVTERYPKLAAVGFAAEPGNDLESARRKLEEKGLIAIFLNDVSRPDIGFESDQNEGVLLLKTGQSVAFRKASKYEIAWRILDTVRPLIPPQ
jgi:phosphopantothenoylcysteine decarboxylase/phosphopantothenate--cysteine ligase